MQRFPQLIPRTSLEIPQFVVAKSKRENFIAQNHTITVIANPPGILAPLGVRAIGSTALPDHTRAWLRCVLSFVSNSSPGNKNAGCLCSRPFHSAACFSAASIAPGPPRIRTRNIAPAVHNPGTPWRCAASASARQGPRNSRRNLSVPAYYFHTNGGYPSRSPRSQRDMSMAWTWKTSPMGIRSFKKGCMISSCLRF